MRRLTRRDDRGLVTLLLVLALPALLMMGSLVFDGARGLLGAREAQNAADAAALAKATDSSMAGRCADTVLSNYATNGTSLDNASCPTSTTAKVTMKKNIALAFARGGGTRPVTRSATATWGALTVANGVFPITIASCAFQGLNAGQKVTLHAHNFGTCSNPSGQFGWTDIDCANPTQVTVGAGFGIGGTTGNTPKSCNDTQLDSFVGKNVLVPVWDPTTTSCGKTYCLTTFAEFHLTGWTGNGASHVNARPPGSLQKQCNASGDGDVDYHENTPCIRGYFVRFTQSSGQSSTGPCNTLTVLFACRVYLIPS